MTTRLFLTEVDRDVDGDTFFPEFDRRQWTEAARREGQTPGVLFIELIRAE